MKALAAKPLLKEDLEHILTHARQDFQSLRGARLFVTGGTGFFGKWLISSFLYASHKLDLDARMVLLTRNASRFRAECPDLAAHSSISLCQGDVQTFEFPQGVFSHVIHGAVAPGIQPLEIFDSIVEGTRRTLAFAAGAGVRRFLLLSSGAVYGQQPKDMTHIPESYSGGPDPLQPGSGYSEGKRAAEHLCGALGHVHGFDAIVARGFAFSGPHLPLDANFAIGNFIADVLAGRTIRIRGDGTPYRSYLYAADLAVWLWALLVRGQQGRAYNVGSDEDLTITELACAVAEVAGSKAGVQMAQQPKPGAAPLRYVPSIERARSELGLECRINLKEGIGRTLDWLR
jgi:dTDP-glucose 4,6-dehydratase